MAKHMDILPNQMIRFAQLGLKDELLASNAIWMCVSCLTCNTRCPKGVKIAEVIEAIRQVQLRARQRSPRCAETGAGGAGDASAHRPHRQHEEVHIVTARRGDCPARAAPFQPGIAKGALYGKMTRHGMDRRSLSTGG